MIGATGAGKTTTLTAAVWQHIQAGFGVVLIDPKGDPALVAWARAEALQWGRPFYCFSLDRPAQAWNPLAAGGPSEQADKLIAAEEWTEPHYKRLYQRYLLNAFTAIRARGQTAHLAQVVDLLDPDRLAMYCARSTARSTPTASPATSSNSPQTSAASSPDCETGSRCSPKANTDRSSSHLTTLPR